MDLDVSFDFLNFFFFENCVRVLSLAVEKKMCWPVENGIYIKILLAGKSVVSVAHYP